ncbi:MAG TPA: type II CAAX endopeptidase family protein [Longimicrobiales bacterium]|nr:type II CAAX endopeptidase family protein [Longimicrobiales bacterium]
MTFLVLREGTAAWGVGGIALAEWVALVGIPAGLLLLRPGPPGRVTRAVGLRPIPLRTTLASVALGAACLPVAWTVFWLQSPLIPPDGGVVEALNREMIPGDPRAFVLLALAVAVTPALCEEFIFRGVLLNGVRGRLAAGWAVSGSALLFGLLHWAPGGSFRVLPAAALGVILGWAVWRGRTLAAPILVHLTHNLLILTASTAAAWGPEPPPLSAAPGAPPLVLVAGGVALLALGGQLLAPATPDPPLTDHTTDPHVH